jgi:hypothetical protein
MRVALPGSAALVVDLTQMMEQLARELAEKKRAS